MIQLIRRMPALLYPERCALCDCVLYSKEHMICRECRSDIPFLHQPLCCICSRPLTDPGEELCRSCKQKKPDFLENITPFAYTGHVRGSVLRMKYKGRAEYAKFYGRAMAEYMREKIPYWQPEVLLPVPIHYSRYCKRGYNQAELLAEKLSQYTGIPMDHELLIRVRRTKAQKELDPLQRRRNLEHAFALTERKTAYTSVVLVDDICTTGSTLNAICSLLMQNGVGRVYAVCACIRP